MPAGLSASTIARLKDAWADEHGRWLKRDLSARRYVYFWADGIHVRARLEDDAQCLLVIIGATPVCARYSSVPCGINQPSPWRPTPNGRAGNFLQSFLSARRFDSPTGALRESASQGTEPWAP